MRLGLLIVSITAVAVVLVQIERAEVRVGHETRRLQAEQVSLHRELGNQRLYLSELTSPSRVRRMVEAMSLHLTERTPAAYTANAAVGMAGTRPLPQLSTDLRSSR